MWRCQRSKRTGRWNQSAWSRLKPVKRRGRCAPGTSGRPCRAAGSRWRTRAAPCAAAGRHRRRAGRRIQCERRPSAEGRRGRWAARRCAGRAGAVARPSWSRVRSQLRGSVAHPVLQHAGAGRAAEPTAAGRRARDPWGWRGTTRSRSGAVRSPCDDGHAPRRHRPAVAHPIDHQLERLVRGTGLDEVGVEGVGVLVGRRSRSPRAGPGRSSARRRRGRSGRAR